MTQETAPNKAESTQKHSKNYWMKLREDSFFEGSPFHYLLKQNNGTDYIVLYQKMCLMSLNSNGILIKKYGEITEPLDKQDIYEALFGSIRKKIINDGIELLIKLHMISVTVDGYYKIEKYESLVGHESNSPAANRKRKQRAKEQNSTNSSQVESVDFSPSKNSRHLQFEEIESMMIG